MKALNPPCMGEDRVRVQQGGLGAGKWTMDHGKLETGMRQGGGHAPLPPSADKGKAQKLSEFQLFHGGSMRGTNSPAVP